MKPLRHIGFLLWLALAVAMGQQAAALHALSHATEKLSQQRDSTPAPSKCDVHGLFVAFSGAVGAKAPVAPLVVASAPRAAAARERDATLAPRHAFRPRAPPEALA